MNIEYKVGDLVRVLDKNSIDPFEALEHFDNPHWKREEHLDQEQGLGIIAKVHPPHELPPRHWHEDGTPMIESVGARYEVMINGLIRGVSPVLLEKIE